eukprot:TRINITY_DN29337_c0_g1_i1.p1 TRINITY_DN29337_c0_g1~~TRINITY_DN29337_c0_g1_i1.p1  ORF type:complete len:979 (+),score=151.60 TRINITY_DN29337_c0_g1_i1:210-3146(+)
MNGSGIIDATAGAVIGGAVVMAGVKAHIAIVNMAKQCVGAEEHKQFMVVSDLVKEHLDNFIMKSSELFDSLRPTYDELQTMAPAFPEARLAFDAILKHQKHMEGQSELSWVAGLAAHFANRDENGLRITPAMLACELVKAWLRVACQNEHVPSEEVEAYRNFCRSFVNHKVNFPGSGEHSFVVAMSHAAQHMDAMLKYVLRVRRVSARNMRNLHAELYHFVLHSLQVLLLAPTCYEIPADAYSIESLAFLYDSTLPLALLDSYARKIAAEQATFWETDCGRLLQRMLRSTYGSNLCAWMDGKHEEVKTVEILVRSAENLPAYAFAFDTLQVHVRVRRQGKHGMKETVSLAQTSMSFDPKNPVWDQRLEIEVPSGKGISVHLELAGSDMLGTSVSFASAPAMAGKEILESGSERRLPLGLLSEAWSPDLPWEGQPTLVVRFRQPDLQDELCKVREKWQVGNFENSGLEYMHLAEAFLECVVELDNLMYFMDILFTHCLELANLLGDLGMVACARFVGPLLDELEQHIIDVTALISREIFDRIFDEKLEMTRLAGRGRCNCCYFLFADSSLSRDVYIENSIKKMQSLARKVGTSVISLRHAARSLTVVGIQEETKQRLQDLVGILQEHSTSMRTNRFLSVLDDSSLSSLGMIQDSRLRNDNEDACGAPEETADPKGALAICDVVVASKSPGAEKEAGHGGVVASSAEITTDGTWSSMSQDPFFQHMDPFLPGRCKAEVDYNEELQTLRFAASTASNPSCTSKYSCRGDLRNSCNLEEAAKLIPGPGRRREVVVKLLSPRQAAHPELEQPSPIDILADEAVARARRTTSSQGGAWTARSLSSSSRSRSSSPCSQRRSRSPYGPSEFVRKVLELPDDAEPAAKHTGTDPCRTGATESTGSATATGLGHEVANSRREGLRLQAPTGIDYGVPSPRSEWCENWTPTAAPYNEAEQDAAFGGRKGMNRQAGFELDSLVPAEYWPF